MIKFENTSGPTWASACVDIFNDGVYMGKLAVYRETLMSTKLYLAYELPENDPYFPKGFLIKAKGIFESAFKNHVIWAKIDLSNKKAVKFAEFFGMCKVESGHEENLAIFEREL